MAYVQWCFQAGEADWRSAPVGRFDGGSGAEMLAGFFECADFGHEPVVTGFPAGGFGDAPQ